MKMSSLIFACVAMACLVSDIGAVSKNSRPTTTPVPDLCQLPGYDVSELKSRDYWVANITGQPLACVDRADHGNCTYYFAFCHELHLPKTVSAANCHGAAVCQIGYTNTTQNSYSLGMYTDDLQFYQSEGGFSMDISGGSNTTNCTAGISTTVKLVCNESAMWTSKNKNLTEFISVVWTSETPTLGCPHFQVSLQYSGACIQVSNHSVSPTHVMPTSTRGHMNHTTQHPHPPHMNTSMHSMHLTTSHSAGNHSSTKHPGSTNHHPGTSHHVHSTSPTKASSSTKTHPPSSPTKPVPSATPHPPHHTTPHPNSPTKPATKPTENPLEHKVAGLTAGVVIFALISFGLVVALVGVIYYFYKRGGGRYSKVTNINDE